IAPSLGRPTDGLIASLSKTASDRVEFYEGVGRALGGLPPDRRAEVMERCVQASRARWGDGAYALMADAIVRSWGPNLVVLDWARIDRGYQDLDQRYPSWTHAQKRLFHAYLFQKKKEAMEQVEAMGIDRVDFRFFGGTGNLKQFKDWLEE
ncbi:MAG: hypothetical protein KC910_13335, partial [Candidatus Eremiobacteraeota bacterium]|nr:hypothetical protein [Candidatus Eremiobacteraeota bacterium]